MKITATKQSYGFRGKLWEEGETADVRKDEKYPKEHFKTASSKYADEHEEDLEEPDEDLDHDDEEPSLIKNSVNKLKGALGIKPKSEKEHSMSEHEVKDAPEHEKEEISKGNEKKPDVKKPDVKQPGNEEVKAPKVK